MRADEGHLYTGWVAANGVGEAIGLGTTFVLGWAVAATLEAMTGVPAILAGALLAIALGVVLEGVVVGLAQERVLRDRLAGLPRGRWTLATAVGAGLAWAMGMIPSTVVSLTAGNAGGEPMPEPGPAVRYGLAIVMGLVTGPILGVAQWMVLRRVLSHAWHWLWANALAWAVGMAVIFIGMDLVPWTGPASAIAASLYAVSAAAGLAVGAVHGRVLVALIRRTGPVRSRGLTR